VHILFDVLKGEDQRFSGKRSTLALAIAAVTAMSGWVVIPQASAAGFIDGGNSQRQRTTFATKRTHVHILFDVLKGEDQRST
jgi:hypothetical protein